MGSQEQDDRRIGDITFADDIDVPTNTVPDLKHQAAKLSRYAEWGYLTINNTKSTVSGALHRSYPAMPYDEQVLTMQLTNTIRVQGRPITYQSPKQPFRHLGALLTMDLNYKHQLQATIDKVKGMTTELKHSLLSAQHKLRIIESSIRPAITYAMCIAPYTEAELKLLDLLLTRAAKQAFKLPVTLPTAIAHTPQDKGGLGCYSLEVDHTVICVQRLCRALNHQGP